MGTVILTIWKVSLWLFWFFAAILYMRMSPFLSLGGSERPSQGLRPNTSARHYTWDKTSWALFLFACTPHILYFLYSAYGFRLDVQVTVHSFQYIQYRLIFKIYYYVLRSFSLHGLDIYFCEHYYSFSSRCSMVHVAVSIFQNLQYRSAAALPLWLLSISAKVQQCEKNAIASADKF